MPDAKPVRMWGVWSDWSKSFLETAMTRERADALAKEGHGLWRVIPGTFTPDEEGSDEATD